MVGAITKLKKVYAALRQKQQHFANKSVCHVVVYRGVITIEHDSDLNDVLNFRYAFNPQQFNGVVSEVANTETIALAHYQRLFCASFAKAIKMIFY
jgi:hypothetical protein